MSELNDRINLSVLSRSEAETEAFARDLAQQLKPGTILTLNGQLGAGKTVFARGFARGLGVTEPVSSPTYTIVQEYALPDGRSWLYHLDLYRISDENSALGFGVDEFLDDMDAYVLLEWPERIAKIIPARHIEVNLRRVDELTREITAISRP